MSSIAGIYLYMSTRTERQQYFFYQVLAAGARRRSVEDKTARNGPGPMANARNEGHDQRLLFAVADAHKIPPLPDDVRIVVF
jgi:hypothetical protein